MSTHYDAIVIGSGQAGGPLAQAFAAAGQKTALIESTHVGGTCVNEGRGILQSICLFHTDSEQDVPQQRQWWHPLE